MYTIGLLKYILVICFSFDSMLHFLWPILDLGLLKNKTQGELDEHKWIYQL